MEGPKRSETFGRLLKAGLNSIATVEGKTGPAVDAEIGAQVALAGTTLQRYRSGYLPSDHSFVACVAEACVTRGLMGRSWLEKFLQAAYFPPYEARALVMRLFSQTSTVAQGTRLRPNLPPSQGRFVMRRNAYDGVCAGLRSDLSLTAIVSLGGMGKTSLARALAADCLQPGSNPHFPAVAWVSDKDHPGTTNLSLALDLILQALDYPGLAAEPFATKRHTVADLLRIQPTLLVIDNAETITDQGLIEWLSQVPAPSKVLLTSRNALPAYIPHTLVEIDPLDQDQARELIAERVAQGGWRTRLDLVSQLLPLADAAGGNPKAIEVALGLVQRQRRPLGIVLNDLRDATVDTLFDDLFARAWEGLDHAARRTLLAIPFFPTTVGEVALSYVADLLPASAVQTITRLVDLSLLDVEWEDLSAPPRYTAHPLVRAFAAARLAEHPTEATALRARWLRWCVDLAESVGFCWDDLDRLGQLDQNHLTIQAALEWAAASGSDRETVVLAEGVRYYYNVRGLWDERRIGNYELRAMAARRLGDASELVLALTQHAEVLSKQDSLTSATALLAEAESVAAGVVLSADAAFELGHARALLAYAAGDSAAAETHWRALLPFASELGGQKHVINRRWLATCLLTQGRVTEAIPLYEVSLADAETCNDLRSVTGNSLKLATIDLDHGNLEAAEIALERCRVAAEEHQDRRRLAEYYRLTARLRAAQGDQSGAAAALAQAVDLFERMGMRRDAAAAREILAATR